MTLEPKQAFQKNEVQTKAFRDLVDSSAFKEGVHNAIAQFVLKSKPTTEELEGVRRFLDTFINFGEKEEAQDKAPFFESLAARTALKPQPKK